MNNKFLYSNKESGQAVLIAVILSLVISTSILFAISLPVLNQIKNSNEYISSKQAILNAETSTEEVLYRLNKNKIPPSVLGISVLKDVTSVSTLDLGGSLKQTTASCQYNLFTRKLSSLMSSNRTILFNYGAWLSGGGLRLENNTSINGNVFSLGGGYVPDITSIHGVYSTTTYAVNFPVSNTDILNWKNQASSGQVINGSVSLVNKSTTTTGALKIVGDLSIKNSGSIMTLNGPLYVTGNLIVENSSGIQLGAGYGSKSETIVVDGTIKVKTSAFIKGSGQNGSNILLVTQNTAGCPDYNCTNIAPAIEISQSALADTILIAPYGAVYLENGSDTKGVLANYLYMSNSSKIFYDTSLIGINFNSSTSTFWSINSISEI